MGFEIQDRIGLLHLDDEEYGGAEVKVRLNLPLRDFLRLDALADQENFEELLTEFGESILVEWNLEKDGEPIPADGPHFVQQPVDFCMLIYRVWRVEVAEPPRPLSQPSVNGAQMEAALNLESFSA